MSGVEKTDLVQHMDRLVRLAAKLGRNTEGWVLVEGDAAATPRTTTRIEENGTTLVTLGYTRRAALSALAAQNQILAVILGA